MSDMNKTFFLKEEDRKPNWIVIDAKDQIVGRMATQIANILRGKNKATYTPHSDAGDYVIVINAKEVKFSTEDKWKNKVYRWHTFWVGHLHEETAEQVKEKHPTRIIENAVKRMLPRNRQQKHFMRKLRIFEGAEHPHIAQINQQ